MTRLLTLTFLLLLPLTAGASDDVLERARAVELAIQKTIEKVRPAVVSISVQRREANGRLRVGGGSGVIVDESGLVLTNYHVAGEGRRITITLSGRRTVPAHIVGRDEGGDLCLLKIEGEGPYPTVELGNSESLRPGQWVLAMGNPKNVVQDGRAAVTWGTITALHNLGSAAGSRLFYGDAIQTDAEINPGNSGGPLFDLSGRLVGINGRIATLIRTKTGAVNANVGFSIPISQIRTFLPLLRKGGRIRHGWLGVAVNKRSDGRGVDVGYVMPASPAEAAKIRPGDTLLTFEGMPVSSGVRLTNLVSARPAGERVAIRLRRGDEERIVIATLAVRPAPGAEPEVKE